MKNTIVFLIMVTPLLGCYNIGSYSQYVNNETTLSIYPNGDKGCGVYVPLTIRPLPELPFDEIKQAKAVSSAQAEKIMVAHIRDLREHVVNSKKEQDAHYADYLIKCTTVLK